MRSPFAVGGAVVALAACGGGDDRSGYPATTVEGFVKTCSNEPQGSERVCRCVIERLQATMPYDEFRAADQALRSDREPKADSLAKLEAAVELCS